MSQAARVDFMGCPLDAVTMAEALGRVEGYIGTGQPHVHVGLNAAKVALMAQDPELLRCVAQADLITADGSGVVSAARILGKDVPERVAGIDLMLQLLPLAAQRGYRPFFLGSRPEVVEAVAERCVALYPGLEIAGFHDGYFGREGEERVAQQIAASGADLLFVGISSPLKESFLARWKEQMGVPFAMGVGGAFEIVAENLARAPRWMQRAGLEWAWRFGQEPQRMWRRYLLGSGSFVFCTLKARFQGSRPLSP